MNIGKVIEELRLERGLSQIELAIHCDLTLETLSQIEMGSMEASEITIKRLCDFFQIPEEVIFLLATEDSDISASKKDFYSILVPAVKKLVRDIFEIRQRLSRQQ